MPKLQSLRAQRRKRKAPEPDADIEEAVFEDVAVPWLAEPAQTNSESPSLTPISAHPVDQMLADLGVSDDPWFLKKIREILAEPDEHQRSTGHLAAHAGKIDTLKFLLTPMADGQALWSFHNAAQGGYKGIHFAASQGHIECVKLFLSHGTKVNIATSRGQKTPLKLALDHNYEALAEYLRKKGGRVRENAAEFDQVWEKLKSEVDLVKSDIKLAPAPAPAQPVITERSAPELPKRPLESPLGSEKLVPLAVARRAKGQSRALPESGSS